MKKYTAKEVVAKTKEKHPYINQSDWMDMITQLCKENNISVNDRVWFIHEGWWEINKDVNSPEDNYDRAMGVI